jgi:hypothetical protein
MRWWFSYNEGSLCPPLLLDTFISRRLSSLWLMVIYFSHSQWPNDFQIFVLSFGQYSLRFCPHYDQWSFSFRTLNDPMISKFSSSHLDNIHYAFVLTMTHGHYVFVRWMTHGHYVFVLSMTQRLPNFRPLICAMVIMLLSSP